MRFWAAIGIVSSLATSVSAQTLPQGQAPSPAIAAPSPSSDLPRCTAEENRAFLGGGRNPDDDFVYGAGESTTLQAAHNLAIADAMKTLEVKLVGHESVTARESRRNGVTQSELSVGQDVRVQIEQRRSGCERVSSCLGTNGGVRVRARCPRYSEMEQNLRKAAAKLASALPPSATVLVLPPTDEGDTYTQLGYEVQGILQQHLQPPLLQATQKLYIPGKSLSENAKKPPNPTKLWRERGVTHFVVGETSALGGSQLEVRLHLQLASTEEVLPRSLSRFELTLDPRDREKLAVKGSVFPQKAALDLAGTGGDAGGVEVRLSSSKLREGETVEISFRLAEPAYVYVFDIYENGKAALLIPGPPSPDNHFAAGRWFTYPDAEWTKQGYQLKACPLPGDRINRERIKVIATSKPLNLQPDRYAVTDLADMKEGPRGPIAELNQQFSLLQQSGVRIATATAAYDITAIPGKKTGCPRE